MRNLRNRFVLPLALLLLGGGLAPAYAQPEAELRLRRNAIVRAVEKARRAVVSIHTTRLVRRNWYGFELPPFEGKGIGSGVIFHPVGYVITNAHVIERASSVLVDVHHEEGKGQTLKARIVAVDLPHDIAILRLEPPTEGEAVVQYPYLPLGSSDDLMVGETVIALGTPFDIGLTATRGIIGGLHRKLRAGGNEEPPAAAPEQDGRPLWNQPEKVLDDFIQTDAAINPGNSGGPLLDVTGRWIGVNTAIWNRRATAAEGIGFAVPVDSVRGLAERAFKRRIIRGDWLGLELEEGPGGAPRVSHVYPKGPAASSGLQPGDSILSVDGTRTATLFDVHWQLAFPPDGGFVRLGLERDGRALSTPTSIRLLPVPTNALSGQHLGFVAVDFTDEEGGSNRLPMDAGVLVLRVRDGGPAAKVGLQPGDLVVGLGTYRIRHTDDLLLFLQYVQPGDLVKLRILRNVVLRSGRRYLEEKEGMMEAE